MINIPPEKLVHVAFAVNTWSRCHDCEELLGDMMAKDVPPTLRPKRVRKPQTPCPRISRARERRESVMAMVKAGYAALDIAEALKVSTSLVREVMREAKRADA